MASIGLVRLISGKCCGVGLEGASSGVNGQDGDLAATGRLGSAGRAMMKGAEAKRLHIEGGRSGESSWRVASNNEKQRPEATIDVHHPARRRMNELHLFPTCWTGSTLWHRVCARPVLFRIATWLPTVRCLLHHDGVATTCTSPLIDPERPQRLFPPPPLRVCHSSLHLGTGHASLSCSRRSR